MSAAAGSGTINRLRPALVCRHVAALDASTIPGRLNGMDARDGSNFGDQAGRARRAQEQLSSRIRLHWPPRAARQAPAS